MTVPSGPARLWRSARTLPARTPLRVKLITAVLALVAVGLVITSFAGIAVLRSYLLGQQHSQLAQLEEQAPEFVELYAAYGQTSPGNRESITLFTPGGPPHQVLRPVTRLTRFGVTIFGPGPRFPDTASWLAAHVGKPVEVPASYGSGHWLVEVVPGRDFGISGGSTTATVVVGVDESGVYTTISTLTSIDLVVSVIVLVVLAIVGAAAIRASLRPLADIEATAGAIAAGDLSRRVPDRDPRTEVGRLGRSLNAMLSQIEYGFAARADSESAARRSEERMRQFVADASHELRTPLTAIRGFAEYYRQRGGAAGSERPGLDPAELNRIMRRVEQEAARMGLLVEDMLMLARLDQQRPLDFRTVDLLAMAADAVHDARVIAPDRSVTLTVGAGAALLVRGDETRLRQVIGNLMSNALVHTPAGTPVEVTVRSAPLAGLPPGSGKVQAPAAAPGPRAAAGGTFAVLEVADAGAGLTPQQAERVFERFYRADSARTTGGSGLGLAIAAGLMDAHGGRIWVQSPPSGGAVFGFALPLAPEALPADDPEDEQDEQGNEPEPQPGQAPGTTVSSTG